MKKKDTYTLDKYYNFERQKNYMPMGYLTTEDEIRALCKKNRIVVQSITSYDGFKVIGTRTRSHKECEELTKFINLSGDNTKIYGLHCLYTYDTLIIWKGRLIQERKNIIIGKKDIILKVFLFCLKKVN